MKNNLLCEKYYLCLYVKDNEEQFILSHNPKLSLFYLNKLKGINKIEYFLFPLRLGEAYFIIEKVKQRFESIYHIKLKDIRISNLYRIIKLAFYNLKQKFGLNLIGENGISKAQEYFMQLIEEFGNGMAFRDVQVNVHTLTLDECQGTLFYCPDDKEIEIISSFLEGRKLFGWEVLRGLNEIGIDIKGSVTDILHWFQLNNNLEVKPSITYSEDFSLKCQRCGQTDKILPMECITCGGECNYCESCVSMGEATSCRPIYSWKAPIQLAKSIYEIAQSEEGNTDVFSNDEGIILTKAQKDAYDKLCKYVDSKDERALVVAVCGAGKTEIVFGAIQKALAKGQKVLFAIPRKDVVVELYPRLNKYFNKYNVLPLYGGSPKKYAQSNLVIATTHQTLRFKEAFDLVILDEVDAFPYKESNMLYYAVERAKKKTGKIIYMTATPDNKLLSQSKNRGWQRITIPARYHGHPLPVPEVIRENHKENKRLISSQSATEEEYISAVTWEIIKKSVLEDMVQLFIFVPSINLAERIGKTISEQIESKGIGPRDWVQFSHSKDPKREVKREGFSRGDFPIFVTTTIMERGITVPRANVLVLFSHWEKVFDQGTLIQMAGRAGRSKEYPKGKVIFLGEKVSDAMKDARNIIISLNNQGIKEGYIKQGDKM